MGWLRILLTVLVTLTVADAANAERKAIVIGIKNYTNIGVPKLNNSVIDAQMMADKLQSVGFKVDLLTDADATSDKFEIFWKHYKRTLEKEDELIIYFSGHGLSKDGANYIAMQDLEGPSVGFPKLVTEMQRVSDIARDLEDLQIKIGVIILEACRENIYEPSTHALIGQGGLIVKRENRGTVIWYAASDGQVAKDSSADEADVKGSAFTRVLVKNFDKYKHTDIERFAKEIRQEVHDAAHPIPQDSEMSSNIYQDWCFDGCGTVGKQLSLNVYKADAPLADIRTSISEEKFPNFAAVQGLDSNAIFLGKKSLSGKCSDSVQDGSPFGCDLLIKIVAAEKAGQLPDLPELKTTIRTVTPTNVRRKLPVIKDNQGYYDCVVKTLPENAPVTVSRVVAMAYAHDVFYWGVTPRPITDTCQ